MTDDKDKGNLRLQVWITGGAVIALAWALFAYIDKTEKTSILRNDAMQLQTEAVKEAVKVLEKIQLDQQMHNARQVRQWQDGGSVHPGDYIIRDTAPKSFAEPDDRPWQTIQQKDASE